MSTTALLGTSFHFPTHAIAPHVSGAADPSLSRSTLGFLPNGEAHPGDEPIASKTPTVYIVDDDPELRESLSLMIGSMGLTVEAYASAEAFLDGYRESPDAPQCMVLDVRMPGLSGLGLQQMLRAEGRSIPMIMISGCADIPMAVKAMRAGALDFLEKPISSQTLSTRIREAIDCCVRQQRAICRKNELAKQVERLSTRQREVLDLLIAGERSKQIARQLGIGEKTVAKHRASVLEKMQVDSVVELVRLFADANLADSAEHAAAAPCN